ncbi:MAG: beta-ketoacyl synthase N-terminal-like domain-containing protein, partial [Candidatus Binatia bacterium]
MNKEPIAIIGVGCRFPGGASGPDAFWRLLSDGVDAVREVPADRWNADAYYDPTPGRCGKSITRWGGFVDDVERFDPGFFGISPREAAFMDPQQRMLLEVAWEALEDAGQIADSLRGSPTGVFVGISTHDYELLQSSPDERSDIDVYSTTGGVMSIAANRISYCFDLRGPSLAIDTACSSSLVAVHFACASLWSGTSSLALVGGVNALLAPMPFVAFSRMSMLSPTGRCRAFDAAADGFVRGEGAGVIVLKPLAAARKDGDRVYAVIRGTATNQDGRTNGLTVPSAAAQAALVRTACRSAGVDPAAIRYVEAHGTGTPIGDPIEARALGDALGDGRRRGAPCIVGSVKTNIGHLEAGAGIAGIIKLALLLDRGEIPPNLHFREPNPNIDFEGLKLQVPSRAQDLGSIESNGSEILAGINSFGFGGSNAHAVLQALPKPPRQRPRAGVEGARAELLTISARGAEPLRALAESYRIYLGSADGREASFEDICSSAAMSRTHHEQRLALVARSHDEMIARLGEATASEDAFAAAIGQPSEEARTGVVFVFCGQGPQWWAMGRRLLHEEPVFRDKLAECDRLLAERASWRLLEELGHDEAGSRLSETAIAQPAIFSVQVALAALWESWGIRPTAVVGHSVGEVAAAHVSGALDLREAAQVIFERGRSMDLAPERGRMLAVQLDPGDAEQMIRAYGDAVALGAINGPASVTLSGDGEMLDAIRRALEARGVFCRFLQVDYAFHSRQMDPIRDELERALARSRGAVTRTPLISAVTGFEIEGKELDARYWWRNVRETVRFAPAIDHLVDRGWGIFLEVGPHPVLAGPIVECLRRHGRPGVVLPSLRRQEDERTTLLGSLGRLHACGVAVDWRGVFPRVARVALPSYAWQRERFWHESEASRQRRLDPPSPPLLGRALRAALPGWETWLDKEAMPYLLEHRVHSHVVFPAAGYVEVALEVAEQRIGDPPWVLEDVGFQRALILPEGDTPARLQTVFQLEDSSFTMSSSAATATAWTTHCTGKLRAWANPPPAEPAELARLRARCTEQVAPSDFYRRLRDVGLDFGPAFRGIEGVWRRDGEALARLRPTEAVAHERSRYRLHPALLDACFQALSAALPQSAFGEGGSLYLPIHVERLRVRSLAKAPAWSHARLLEKSGNAIVGDLRLLDESGEVLVEVAGFRCQAVARKASSESPEAWIYESRWLPAPLIGRAVTSLAADFLPSGRAIARHARDVLERRQRTGSLRARFLRVESQIDELCAGYAARALRTLGWQPRARAAWSTEVLAAELGVVAEHHAVLGRHLGFLADDGAVMRQAGRWSLRRALPEVACDALWSKILAGFPALLPELTLIRRSGEALAAILRGERDALDVLAPGGSLTVLEELYQDAPSFADYNRAVAAAVGRAVADLPASRTVRVLEVGGGTGGLTAHVLARLPAERTEYVFTDVSSHFFSRAEQKFFDRPFVRCRLLDLEKPPLEQGFEAHSFDIVVASDAVHATARVHDSLAHLHSLLAPEGLLILLEIDRPTRWADLVFGLTPGWWRFQDEELRPAHALLDRSCWCGALARAGFVGVEALGDSLEPRRSGQSLFVARTPARPLASVATPVESAAADRAGNWLLLADRSGLGVRLASLLEARGERVTLAF